MPRSLRKPQDERQELWGLAHWNVERWRHHGSSQTADIEVSVAEAAES